MPPQYTTGSQSCLPGFEPNNRQCIDCRLFLPHTAEFFYAHPGMTSGLLSLCKACHCRQSRERYRANRERRRESGRAYYQAHREHWVEQGRTRYEANKEQILKQHAEYRTANRDVVQQRKAEYRANNREAIRERDREWRQSDAGRRAIAAYKAKTTDKRRERHREYYPQWLSAVPGRRAAHTMGVLMGRALKGQKAGCPWENVVGYTLADLMMHLESKFKPGMIWDNYGRKDWYIDHIVPRSAFTFETAADPQFQECWALANLQPLWELETLSKNNRIL